MSGSYSSALVLGLGVSGTAAARLLCREGSRVTVVDAGRTPELEARADELRRLGAEVVLDCRELPEAHFEVCVASPGIAMDAPWIRAVRDRGIALLTELELGLRRCHGRLLGVTGTRGKSTMVKLCSEALQAGGLRALAAGNCGLAVCDVANSGQALDWLVVEISSFQLELLSDVKPDVGVLLNVQPDHLDRHQWMENYFEIKTRIFARIGPRGTCLVRDQDRDAVQVRLGGTRRWVTFGATPAADSEYREGVLLGKRPGNEFRIALDGGYFANPITGQTAAAAAAALVWGCGLDADAFQRAVRGFRPLPHRMQEVAVLRGVRFVDDSKGTNLAALSAGVVMAGTPVRLIAGGRLKEPDLDSVREMLAMRATKVYLIGESASAMCAAWERDVPCEKVGTLARAVRAAWREAREGETVLLSPGCSSFDQFKNYEERGERFAEAVRELGRERPTPA